MDIIWLIVPIALMIGLCILASKLGKKHALTDKIEVKNSADCSTKIKKNKGIKRIFLTIQILSSLFGGYYSAVCSIPSIDNQLRYGHVSHSEALFSFFLSIIIGGFIAGLISFFIMKMIEKYIYWIIDGFNSS